MRRAARQRMVLIAGVALLVGLALWQWHADQERAPATLLPLDPTTITDITLRPGHGTTEQYQRRDGHWWRIGPHPVRADDGRLSELAATAAAPAMDWRPLSDFDPARIGLDPPNAVLTLDGHALAFGAVSVTGPQTYVRVGRRVALVSLRYQPRPDRALTITPRQ